MPTKVFWVELDRSLVDIYLRRYYRAEYDYSDAGDGTQHAERRPGGECPLMLGKHSYHNKSVFIERRPPLRQCDDLDPNDLIVPEICGDRDYAHDDARWPVHCDCGYVFAESDYWQKNANGLFRGAPDGQLYTIDNLPVGAMWDASWMSKWWQGPDGICLTVKTPGGEWMVDSEASNCTDPAVNHPVGEGEERHHVRTHYCWTRHGDPKSGLVDVGKQYGPTCAAGAGSIVCGSYHGFLRDGYLTD